MSRLDQISALTLNTKDILTLLNFIYKLYELNGIEKNIQFDK